MSVGSLCSPKLQQSTTQGYSRHCNSPEHVLKGALGLPTCKSAGDSHPPTYDLYRRMKSSLAGPHSSSGLSVFPSSPAHAAARCLAQSLHRQFSELSSSAPHSILPCARQAMWRPSNT